MTGFGDALTSDGPDRQEKLEAATTELREELEELGAKATTLALPQPPASLLGYIWGQEFIKRMRGIGKDDEKKSAPSFEQSQFALEYLHAIWSGNSGPFQGGQLDEVKAKELLDVFEVFRTKTLQFCMISSMANRANATELQSDLEFHAKSSWTLIRGHRHQVLEVSYPSTSWSRASTKRLLSSGWIHFARFCQLV